MGVLPKAAIAGTKLAYKAASLGGRGALTFYDYATDADGSRQQASIERGIEEEFAELKKRNSVLASLDEQGERNAAQWARHSDKYAIKPPDGYPVVVNENDPVHTKQTWHSCERERPSPH